MSKSPSDKPAEQAPSAPSRADDTAASGVSPPPGVTPSSTGPSYEERPATIIASPVLSPAPAGWNPDPKLKSRAAGQPLQAQELMNFGGPELTKEAPNTGPVVPWSSDFAGPTAALPVYGSPAPELGEQETPTNVGAIPVLPIPEADEEEIETGLKPVPVTARPTEPPKARAAPQRTRSKPQMQVPTDAVVARPRRATPLAEFDDDSEKKRDRHVAIAVTVLGSLLIGCVYWITKYEEPQQMNLRHAPKEMGFESNTSGGGGKRGGSGGGKFKGKARGGGGYAGTVADTMVADDCVARCSRKQTVCATACGRNEGCRENCLEKVSTCEDSCGAMENRAAVSGGPETLDCYDDSGRAKKCTAADQRRMAQQSKAMRSLCRDDRGEVIACPEQAAKMEAAQNYLSKCGAKCQP